MTDCCSANKIQLDLVGLSNACYSDTKLQSIILDGNFLKLTFSDGSEYSVDLSQFADDTYLSGVSLVNGVLSLTMNNGAVYVEDLSSLTSPYPTNYVTQASGNDIVSTITLSDGTILTSTVTVPHPECGISAPENECYTQTDRTMQIGSGGCPVSVPSLKGNLTSAGGVDVYIDCDGTITVDDTKLLELEQRIVALENP